MSSGVRRVPSSPRSVYKIYRQGAENSKSLRALALVYPSGSAAVQAHRHVRRSVISERTAEQAENAEGIFQWVSLRLRVWPVTFSLLDVISAHSRNSVGSVGRQVLWLWRPDLLTRCGRYRFFVCLCALPPHTAGPAEQAASEWLLTGGGEHRHISPTRGTYPAIVRSQGRFAVAYGARGHAPSGCAAPARAAPPLLLPDRLASAFGHVRRPVAWANELLLRREAAPIRAVGTEYHCSFLLPSHRCAWPPHAHPVPSLRHRLWTAILEQAGPGGHFYRRRGWSPLVFPFQPAPCPPALFCLGGDPLLDASSIFQACCQLNQGSCRQCLRRFPPRFWRLGRLAMARVSWGPARPSARARRMALLVAPSMSQTAPCTRTFICSSLFGILPTRSPRGATSLLSGYSSPPVLDLLLP